jgi:DNA polymerase elongation subunit (family B)
MHGAVVQPNGEVTPQFKGLDLVRRDWCDLSRDMGKYAVL